MTNYYWIIARHSQLALEVEGGNISNGAKIVQFTKKSELDPTVDTQLWYFNGGYITNKRSGLVLSIAESAQIIQHEKYVPSTAQEWDYDYKDNTISLKSNRKFVLDVTGGKCDNHTPIILCYKHGGGNQQFILEKWNDVSLVENIVECIIDNCKFLPKLSQNFLEILNDDEYYDINIEVGNDPHVKIFHAHMAILNYRSSYLRRIFSANKKKNDGTLMHIKLPNILPDIFEIILR
ncbi:ricin B-like lectin [Rhizophagus irregularis]|nr:ricin B-like lectin [Rhizophagus irregularis]